MSISRMEQIRKEIQQIRERNAKHSREIADKNKSILRARSLASQSKSASTKDSYSRSILLLESKINGLQTIMARNDRKITDKSKELMTLETQYQKEQDKKHKELMQSLESARRQQELQLMNDTLPATISRTVQKNFDVFIAHANEDKEEIVNDLAAALRDSDIKVWYDDFVLEWGDSLMRKINEGISKSRYGIVFLSHNFFAKEWPQQELDALYNKEIEGSKVILPIWHNISKAEVAQYSPLIAGKLALKTSDYTIQEICEQVKTLCEKAV